MRVFERCCTLSSITNTSHTDIHPHPHPHPHTRPHKHLEGLVFEGESFKGGELCLHVVIVVKYGKSVLALLRVMVMAVLVVVVMLWLLLVVVVDVGGSGDVVVVVGSSGGCWW